MADIPWSPRGCSIKNYTTHVKVRSLLTGPELKRIWLVAAENDALPKGKVGGVGDVVRDLPIALAGLGLDVSVITPSYGMFHKLPGARFFRKVRVKFAGRSYVAHIHIVPVADSPVEQ